MIKILYKWSPKIVLFLTAIVATATTAANLLFAEKENHWMQSLALVSYGVLVSLFLLALVAGFILSQIQYDEDIESPKNKILEIEGIKKCENII